MTKEVEARPRGHVTTCNKEYCDKAKDYVKNYKKHDHPLPSAVGMAVALGISKSTLYKWALDGHEDISDTLAKCNSAQELELMHKGLTNDFNATIVKLALSNHGYSEKTQTELTGANGGPVQTANTFNFMPVGNKD